MRREKKMNKFEPKNMMAARRIMMTTMLMKHERGESRVGATRGTQGGVCVRATECGA